MTKAALEYSDLFLSGTPKAGFHSSSVDFIKKNLL